MDIVSSVIRFLESFHLEEDLFSEYETDYISSRSCAHARRHFSPTSLKQSRRHHHSGKTSSTCSPKEDLKKANRNLKQRVEELEDDLISASKTIERQRELRGREEVEKTQMSERNKMLEHALKTVRQGYEEEIEEMRAEKEKQEAAAKAKIELKVDKQMQAGPSSPQSPPTPKSPPRLKCNHTDLFRQLREKDEEVRALRYYMDKTDELSTTEIVDLVHSLNDEIRLLAASIADSVPFKKPWEVDRAWAVDTSEPFLQRCLQMLAGGVDYSKDPTLVQIAVQSWLLRGCEVVFERFMFGLVEEEDMVLARVYGCMLQDEQLSVASRWRRLARIYARNADPAFEISLTTAIHQTTSRILHGIDAILCFAGHNLGNAPHHRGRPPPALSAVLFGEKVEEIVRTAVHVANVLAESVASAHYGLVSVEPGIRWNEAVMDSVEPVDVGDGDFISVTCMMGFGMRCTRSAVVVEPQLTGESTLTGSPRIPPPVHTSALVLKPEVLLSTTMSLLQREERV